MNLLEKAKILGESGNHDSCGFKECAVKIKEGLNNIYYAKAEHKTCRIFKTLMDNDCKFDCKYCSNAKGCTKTKAKYEPEELAKIFNHLHKNLDVNGLFLSSGVSGNPDTVTESMIKVVSILRKQYNYKGYVHFKVLPGTSYHLIKQASEISNRMSINIEVPNRSAMSELSSCKDYKIDILRRQAWVSRLNLSGGQTTQLMLTNHSTDKDVLKMVDWEYSAFNLRRIYFKSFTPLKGTPLQNEAAQPIERQNHLYNVDFLLRQYNYKLKEFDSILNEGMLPKQDPKLAIAKATFDNPLDINQASYEELIRVPGIGPKTASKIIERKEKFTNYVQLRDAGVILNRARPFLNVDGKRQAMLSEF
jgi:predicted DNA-binding helix-hairpin-helix protein